MNHSPKPSHHSWHGHHFNAMGCRMSAWLELADEQTARSALCQVEALFHAAEARMTRFVEKSELSQLNAQAGEWVTLSNTLWSVISRALQLAEQTNGLFDPTLLNALAGAGYTSDFTALKQQQHLYAHRAYSATEDRGRWRDVQVDPVHHAIRIPCGVRLDLGGIGKGFTAQHAVNFLNHWGPCLVDAGGDLVAGDAPHDLPGWSVAIAAPSVANPTVDEVAHEEDLARIWLKNATLATSGIDYRHWQRDGQTMHHIIDPQTGKPAQTDLLTVSVLAAEATVAEAWATALLVANANDTIASSMKRVMKQVAAAFVDQQQKLTITPALHPFLQMHPVL